MMETERLLLRPPIMQDMDAFFDLFSDADTCRNDGGYEPLLPDEALFRQIAEDAENRLFIVEKTGGRMIGVLHLMPAPDAMELGYAVHRDFRRKGYASEAVQAVLDMLAQKGIRRVRCTAYQFNTASQRMLQKLGFVCVGTAEKQNPEWNEAVYEKQL